MNTINKNGFLLLARNSERYHQLPLEQLQDLIRRNRAWLEGLAAQGKLQAGHPLERAGAIVSRQNGRLISDGPFAESKEAIGGYLLLNVGTLAEAIAIAEASPALDYGVRMEVRPVAEECSSVVRARELELQGQLATVAA